MGCCGLLWAATGNQREAVEEGKRGLTLSASQGRCRGPCTFQENQVGNQTNNRASFFSTRYIEHGLAGTPVGTRLSSLALAPENKRHALLTLSITTASQRHARPRHTLSHKATP